ncbi:MAG: UMP kinase [archaeon]
MKRRIIVISLGGSMIIPDEVNSNFLEKFKKIINKNTKNYKFILVTGGGSLARKYISALKNNSYKIQSTAGIAATRANAKFVSVYFNQDPEQVIPTTMKKLKKLIKKQDIAICGALGYKVKQTTDSTACEIAAYFNTIFINITNVQGLYDKNPQKFKNAKFISEISWEDFYKMVNKFAFKPGQHFPLDQTSAKIIRDNKIPAYIFGLDLKNLDNFLNNKKFKGTTISR